MNSVHIMLNFFCFFLCLFLLFLFFLLQFSPAGHRDAARDEKQPDDTYAIGAAIKKDDVFEKWRESFPFRVGHDHPNEVSAYLSGILLDSDWLKIENTEFTESQKNRIDQTRRAFRRALRVDGE